ncbi:MAG: hypothetical protein WKG07_22130 [Hymenobacter sp.]
MGNAVRLDRHRSGQAGVLARAAGLLGGLYAGHKVTSRHEPTIATKTGAYCAQQGIDAVIPNRPNRAVPGPDRRASSTVPRPQQN